jgi:hypothetical protein
VLDDGVIVGRIFKVPIAPQDRHWVWWRRRKQLLQYGIAALPARRRLDAAG